MNATPEAVPSRRNLTEHLVNWRTAALVGACVAGGMTLTVMVIGSASQAVVGALPAETAPPTAPLPTAVVPVPVTESTTTGVDTIATAPADTVATTIPVVAVAPTAARTDKTVVQAAPALFVPAGGSVVASPTPAPTIGTQPASTPTVAPQTPTSPPTLNVPQSPVPGVEVVAVTPAPAAPAVPTPTPSVAATPAPAPAPTVAYTYPSYSVGSLASVTLRFDGSTISVGSVTTQANWVYQVDRNGPRSVEVKFFNVQTEREAEFHASVENGSIKVETGGAG